MTSSRHYLKISLISLILAATAATLSSAAPASKANTQKPSPAQTQALLVDQAVIEALERIKPAIVSIIVKERVRTQATTVIVLDSATGESRTIEQPSKFVFQEAARGSGIIVDSRGYILTNKHVVNFKDALIKVFLANGDIVDGYIIGLDSVNDLAVLKINGGKYTAATLGDSDLVRIGQSVMAIGYSLGKLENTVTRGIVSGLGRVVTADVPGGGGTETISDTIQTDASINPGNSGGPLVNLRGEVVGITTAVEQVGRGIGYTIPINLAKPAVKTAIEKGKIIRARLGVRYVMITPEIREARALAIKDGALLVKNENLPAAVPNGPAARAGLTDGDIITEVNKIPLSITNSLQNMVSKFDPGKTLTLTVIRAGAKLKIPVTLDEFTQ